MPDPNTRLTIRMVHPDRHDNQSTMRIDVEDVSSHLLIASLELEPKHVMQLLGNQRVGSVEGVPAFLIPAGMREHLGKTNVHVTRSLPSRPPTQSGLTTDRWKAEIAQWADFAKHAIGATKATVNGNNLGRVVIVLRHYVPADQAGTWVSLSQRALDDMALPAAWKVNGTP